MVELNTLDDYKQTRPQSLEAFEALRRENASILASEKEKGRRIIGAYCTYFPRELILAMGGISVGLCGTIDDPIAIAEKELPRNLCPLIKSSYGLAISGRCPYFVLADMVIGETTCDGKKKMFELLAKKDVNNIYVMQLPQMPDEEASLQLWISELRRLKTHLENTFAVQITDDAIREAIRLTNEEARARQAMFDLNKRVPAVLSGMDLVNITFLTGFQADRHESIRMVEAVAAELEEKAQNGYAVGTINTKRILLTGTPVGIGSEKVVELVEEAGALVVAIETCGGYKTVGLRIDETDLRDPIVLLAEKYLKIPCSVMSPNVERLALLERMINDFKIDGVIDLTWQACHTYNVESYEVARLVEDKLRKPFLHLETDYSQSDRETLRVRIEAFMETIDK
ncbi:MAG: 2-hydroxyacyl-CoA dehydratase family protein [Dehalococcoidia bacterium]|nr:2-hydroxyacyl-CoA dehydratase family protein [Dehalococcoidia bacterium]